MCFIFLGGTCDFFADRFNLIFVQPRQVFDEFADIEDEDELEEE